MLFKIIPEIFSSECRMDCEDLDNDSAWGDVRPEDEFCLKVYE